jgi:serine protease AprX
MANLRTLKVFASESDRGVAADGLTVIERYAGFLLATAKPAQADRLARRYPVEDITDQYAIQVGDETIRTDGKKGAARKLGTGPHHYLVQFIGPIKPAWLRSVERAGGEVRESRSGFTCVVRAKAGALAKIAAFPFVRWVGHLPHELRIAPALKPRKARKPSPARQVLPRTHTLAGAYVVEFFGREDRDKAVSAVRRTGAKILAKDAKTKVLVMRMDGAANRLQKGLAEVSRIHGVKLIRERFIKRTSNDVATRVMYASQSAPNPGLGLSGKGEYVAICDTGIDSGDPAAIHPDFKGRLASVTSYPITPDFAADVTNPGANDGPADVGDGHGTHVAGSVLGNGSASTSLSNQNPIRGLAYEAKLVFQAVEQEVDWKKASDEREYGRFVLAGIPADLGVLLKAAYKAKARVHSNSWGGGDPGAYDSQCEQLDRFVWEHPDFCILVASGNDGTDKDGDGEINPMSVTSPGTAKNCITVGASENLRHNFDDETYGTWWPDDYPAAPFSEDPMADDVDQVVPFSSRGPTTDGRIKPDVIAPGTFILSTRSRHIPISEKGWKPFPNSRLYFYMGGTSMATPLTSGAVALLREYFRTRRGVAKPTAALLKAALIAGATRLPGYAATSALADNQQGFGRVHLDAVVSPKAPAKVGFVEVAPGLGTGDLHAFNIKVKSSRAPLRIVLVYSDYPGPTLVNNLNLLVTSPTGRHYVGNHAASGVLQMDAKNNVEVIQVKKPHAGAWKVQIVGANVPQGPQPFAIVFIADADV